MPPDDDPELTRLVLPVPELTGVVPGAHIALLDPFLPVRQVNEGVVVELRELFAEVVPFAFVLGDPVRFPSGAAYLPPQPVGSFRRIITAVRRAFPELGGPAASLRDAILHLTLPDDAVGDVSGPVEAHAREAALVGSDGSVIATFRFGASAA